MIIWRDTALSPMTVTRVVRAGDSRSDRHLHRERHGSDGSRRDRRMFGSGILPATANAMEVSSVTGTIAAGMLVTDGGVNIAPTMPILMGAVGADGRRRGDLGHQPDLLSAEPHHTV